MGNGLERRRAWTFVLVGLAASAGMLFAGCGSSESGDASLTVYLSAPLSGPFAADGADVEAGARRALADAGGEAGDVPIDLEVLDDAGRRGAEDARAAANARLATEDSTAIAYIGELDSGTTRASVPITNEAGVLQVSAGASAVDLTRSAPGIDEIPEEVQPSGSRTFGRVIPSDTVQGEAAAVAMAENGIASILPIESDSVYAETLLDGFESISNAPSVAPSGFQGSVDGLYVTSVRPEPEILDSGGRIPVLGADAQAIGEPVRAELPPGSTVITGTIAPEQLPDPDPDRAGDGRFGAYGYEAMAVVLDSIGRAGDPLDRASVVEAFFATADRESVLGTYSIDEVGDTTLGAVGIWEVEANGELRPAPEPIDVP